MDFVDFVSEMHVWLQENIVEYKHHKLARSLRSGPTDRDLKPNASTRDQLNVSDITDRNYVFMLNTEIANVMLFHGLTLLRHIEYAFLHIFNYAAKVWQGH